MPHSRYLIATALISLVTPATATVAPAAAATSLPTVPGQSYEICTNPTAHSEYLTSPWTYQVPQATLSAPTGTATITSLNINNYALGGSLSAGSNVTVSYGGTVQTFTEASDIGAGTITSIPVQPATPVINFPAGAHIMIGPITYTVAQYEAINGYGTTLPPLPSYLANEPASAMAAEIFTPNGSKSAGVAISPYNPVMLYFITGGNYPAGISGTQLVSGDEVIGGRAPRYIQPVGTGGNGFGASDAHWNAYPGYGVVADAVTASTTITAMPGFNAGGWNGQGGNLTTVYFADGTITGLAGISGGTVTLASPVTEPAGEPFWLGGQVLGTVATAAPAGATTLTLTPSDGMPYVPWDQLDIGAVINGAATIDHVIVQSVSGDTLTLVNPLSAAVPAGSPASYSGVAGGVTVEYITEVHPPASGTNPFFGASAGWTIEHNNIYGSYAGGAAYATTNAAGQAIGGITYGTVEYNCFGTFGEYAMNGGGTSTVFDYNQVNRTPYNPDLSGNGQSGCGKWWASTNNDIVDNAFTNEGRSACIWFDNGNTGMLVQGNYFYDIGSRAIQNETGYNSEYIGNLFEDVQAGIYMNDSGGWDIPGSRFNNEVLIENNTFYNAQEAINIWGASGRSCLNSGEAVGAESAPYCSGGFPQLGILDPTTQYFTHYFDSNLYPAARVLGNESCSATSPCSTVVLSGPLAIGDWLGFARQAPDAGTSAPVQVATSSTVDVSTLTGSQSLPVPSTAGFPFSGQLIANTSCGTLYLAVGAVLSYTSTTPTSFEGVKLVSGCGTLNGTLEAVQPYQVQSVSCSGQCDAGAVITVSPAITTDVTGGTAVYTTGTCSYYVTATASASSPIAPNGTSYYDGCMWEDRNITVQGNTFDVDPTQFTSTPPPEGGIAWTCTTGPGGNCAQNATGFQYPGGDAAPYNSVTLSNAMMSNSSFPAPYNNLNASGSPLPGTSSEAPYNDLWSGNTYVGDWTFQAYTQAADCPVNWTGSALEWAGANGNACSGLSLAQWQTIWQQDTTSTPPPPAPPPPPTGSGVVTAGDSKTNCIILSNFPNGTGLSDAEAATGVTFNCIGTYINGATTWQQWVSPWIDTPSAGWTSWEAADPSNRTLVIGTDLVPNSVDEPSGSWPPDPSAWEPECAAGDYNSYAAQLAQNLIAAGFGNAVIRLGFEMNGPWEQDYAGNTTTEMNQWAQCFAQEVTAMRAVPGAHFLFDWNPNACVENDPLSALYPGNAYVDIIGVDAYDSFCNGSHPTPSAQTFQQLASEPDGLFAVTAFAQAQGKPMSLPEWGTVAAPPTGSGLGDDPYYVAGIGQWVASNDVAFQEYFDTGGDTILPLTSADPQTLAAYKVAF